MGTADRDYSREGKETGGFLSSISPVVRWLLILNVGFFIVDVILKQRLSDEFAFVIGRAILQARIWEFITFQFLHANVLHLLGNCIGLYFFGPIMERWWGSRKFLAFYLLSGVGGVVFFTLLAVGGLLPGGIHTSLIGASAGLYGIIVGVAVIAPQMRVRLLFPPVELTMKQVALIVLAIAGGSVLLKIGTNQGGEAGHLGGALLGFLFVRYPGLLSWAGAYDPDVEIVTPKRRLKKSEAKIRPRSSVDLRTSSEVDAILDKISREGFQSITAEERAILERAAANPKSPSK